MSAGKFPDSRRYVLRLHCLNRSVTDKDFPKAFVWRLSDQPTINSCATRPMPSPPLSSEAVGKLESALTDAVKSSLGSLSRGAAEAIAKCLIALSEGAEKPSAPPRDASLSESLRSEMPALASPLSKAVNEVVTNPSGEPMKIVADSLLAVSAPPPPPPPAAAEPRCCRSGAGRRAPRRTAGRRAFDGARRHAGRRRAGGRRY